MRQLIQNVRTGDLTLETVPPPAVGAGQVLVRTTASLISAGTEKMLIDLASKSLVGKARARPDLVKQVFGKIKKEGLLPTLRNVQSKLDKPLPLGYSAAGIVVSTGDRVSGFSPGDRVAIAGAGYANHAEMNAVPRNLVTHVPEQVSLEEAAYATVSSIALQGVRLARPQLGESVVVIGLGLIGLITVQLLRANGCRVVGIDLDADKVNRARTLGVDLALDPSASDLDAEISRFTGGHGADFTFLTASTPANGPIEQAGRFTRTRGTVVAVGSVGMDIPRDVYYKKELDVRISMSYGPGRYDPSYEEGGQDYPYPYVRWTEGRNLDAVLELMASRRLDVKSLTTHEFPFDRSLEAYDLIQEKTEPFVGLLLKYDSEVQHESAVVIRPVAGNRNPSKLRVGVIGAGNYASLHLLPHLAKSDAVDLVTIATSTGPSARQTAEKFGFATCTTHPAEILTAPDIDAVVIATRHDSHARYTIDALASGKHVFVEKPLAVNPEQLSAILDAWKLANLQQATGLMVGVNRRFSPMVAEVIHAFPAGDPVSMLYRVNSGFIPTNTWLHQPENGAGMLIGEMCHFIDVMQAVCQRPARSVFAQSLSLRSDQYSDLDNVSMVIQFEGGSVGTLVYSTIGDKSFGKERLEVTGSGALAVLDDFRRLTISKNGRKKTKRSAGQNKGQADMLTQTLTGFLRNGQGPVPAETLFQTMNIVFAAHESVVTGQPVRLNEV